MPDAGLFHNSATALVVALAVTALLGAVLLRLARPAALLKDQLIPQIAPVEQCFSLAKTQLGFWATLYLGCFLYMVAVKLLHSAGGATLDTSGMINLQVLTLLGLSGATAIGGGVVDSQQDTPEDSVNDGLKALGLNDHVDVARLRGAIAQLLAALGKATPLSVAELGCLSPAQAKALNLPVSGTLDAAADAVLRPLLLGILRDKQLALQSFEQATQGFCTQGWFRDMVTDINGTALHRLQSLVWNVMLGLIFVYDVYQSNSAPTLDPYLLALIGVSGAGYVGFKINETQYQGP